MGVINQTVDQTLTLNQSTSKKIHARSSLYNIVRWIWSSVSKHFDLIKNEIPFYVEGQDHKDEEDSAELRINGPFVNNPSKGYWKIDADINILITATMDQDFYRIYKIIDQFLEGFTSIIPVYKYGDSGEQLGCLILQTDIQDAIIISNFGRIEPSLRVQQSTINGIYTIEIMEGT